jgi:hypothetical protein
MQPASPAAYLEAGVLPDAEGVGGVLGDVLLAVDVLRTLQRCRLGHALERKRAAAGFYCDLADTAEGTLAKQLTLLEHQLTWQEEQQQTLLEVQMDMVNKHLGI